MSPTQVQARFWVVIPAAGVGSRMGATLPKQYLPLAGRTVIEHTLARFCNHPKIAGIVVALSAEDPHWEHLAISSRHPLIRARGGAQRCDSVLNALQALATMADDSDWVLVHDAARPCLRESDLDHLIDVLGNHPVGGLLAVPVRDTMKRSDEHESVLSTVDREHLWHALTPQMFRFGRLQQALRQALADGVVVTDEASAMEHAGHRPLLVEGHGDNIKVTRPEDLPLAEFFVRQQELERV